MNNDSNRKIIGNVCEVISIFQYTICIFYAQLVLTTQIQKNNANDHDDNDVSAKFIWIFFETMAFYLYMLSTVGYIAFRQLQSTFAPKEHSDVKKLLTDFIKYAELNLTWFNLNFVLCTIPLLVLLWLAPQYESLLDLDVTQKGVKYSTLVWMLWVIHCLQFVTRVQIYKEDEHITEANTSIYESNTASAKTDDNFQDAKKLDEGQEDAHVGHKQSHYVHLDRSFNKDGGLRWMIFGTCYIAIFIVYIFSENQEIVYALYVPFDFMTTAAVCIFYFYYEAIDSAQDAEKERLKKYLDEKRRKSIMNSMAAGLKQRL